jgi:hypothetical protein
MEEGGGCKEAAAEKTHSLHNLRLEAGHVAGEHEVLETLRDVGLEIVLADGQGELDALIEPCELRVVAATAWVCVDEDLCVLGGDGVLEGLEHHAELVVEGLDRWRVGGAAVADGGFDGPAEIRFAWAGFSGTVSLLFCYLFEHFDGRLDGEDLDATNRDE